jgi:hypothetical protein
MGGWNRCDESEKGSFWGSDEVETLALPLTLIFTTDGPFWATSAEKLGSMTDDAPFGAATLARTGSVSRFVCLAAAGMAWCLNSR